MAASPLNRLTREGAFLRAGIKACFGASVYSRPVPYGSVPSGALLPAQASLISKPVGLSRFGCRLGPGLPI